MIVCFAELFKTLLDSNYTNVYDEYNDMQQYFDFLESSFDYKRVYQDYDEKALIETDSGARIVLPFHYSDVRDFNYLVLSNNANVYDDEWESVGTNWNYWFVVGGRSLNDNDTFPSCELILVPDSFTNNRMGIGDKGLYGLVNKRHLNNGNIEINESSESPIVYSKGFTSDRSVQCVEDTDSTYGIVWGKVRVDTDGTFRRFDPTLPPLQVDPQITPDEATTVPIEKGTVIIYVPLGRYNYATNKMVQYSSIKLKYTDYEETVSQIFKFDSPHIISISATYVVPFDYSVESSIGELIIAIDDSNASIVYQMTSILESAETVVRGVGSITNYATHTFNVRLPYKSKQSFPNHNSVNDDSNIITEMGLSTYPYDYYVLKIGGQEFPLLSSPNTKYYRIEYDSVNRSNVRFRFAPDYELVNGKIPYNYKWYFNNMDYKIPFSTDSLKMFNATNNAELLNSTTLKAIGGAIATAGGILTANPVLAIGGAGSLASAATGYASKYADAVNTPDKAEIPAGIGTNEVEYLDAPIIIHKHLDEQHLIKLYYNEMHLYGYDYNVTDEISKNFKEYFDFVKCSSIAIRGIHNKYDMDTIEKMYLRGVRRWHLWNTSNYNSILATFNTHVVNYDITLLEV